MRNFLKELGFNQLTEVQRKILEIDIKKNILIISPCGSGKTEAIYNAILNYGTKSIIIQPMRTLATSIYNRVNSYNNILNLSEWTIQHSTMQNDMFLNNKYCVTTIDQVLSGWLGFGKQSFIRGKNVLLSNLIFDEVQLFEPDKTFLTTLNMLKGVVKNGNRFIIMTATMPDYLINFLKEEFNMEVIVCEDDSIKNRNVKINYIKNIDFDIINKYDKKQIIICNEQSHQDYIYRNIKDKDRCIILNSKMTSINRERVEKNIDAYFNKHSPENDKILISTQVIEAGMDISADVVYSAISPIDNLVQRAGRCARWGCDGNFIVFDIKNNVYDNEVVTKTAKILKANQGICFNWEKQKGLINVVLNEFYMECINKKQINKNNIKLKNNRRSELIRDIRNINLIVCNELEICKDDFQRETVSINIQQLNKLNSNSFYKLTNRGVEAINQYEIDVGDTILIQGYDCIYDELGFRYLENHKCKSFDKIENHQDNNVHFNDYEVETWLYHADTVKKLVSDKINNNNIMNYSKDDIEYTSNILGLHDLGKLDVKWQEWAGVKNNQEPLAHFPFTKNRFTYKNRKHKNISAYILKPYINKILFNTILQHHGREIHTDDLIKISEYELHNKYKTILDEYGFLSDIISKDNILSIYPNEIITPHSKDWNEFLYLVGILMESDIESINKQK